MNIPKKLGFVYILLIHLFLALVLWKSDFISSFETKIHLPSADLQYFYNKMASYHRAMDGSIPDGAVIFIGDSITQALATSAITEPDVNFGIGSDTTMGVIKRLHSYKSIGRAKAVVLSIGVNDIHQEMDRADSVKNYKNILDHIPSDVTIIASSILPIGSGVELGSFTNAAITSLNTDIEELVKKYSNVVYVDINSRLEDDAGSLASAFHVGDGVHLSDEGYGVVIEELKATLLGIGEQ